MLLHFALVLHFAAILITFCVDITFWGDYYILRRNTAFQLIESQTATICLFGRFYFLRLSASIRSPKQMQLSWFLRFLTDFRFADFRMIRISAFPVFRISVFLHFRFMCQPKFVGPVEWQVYSKSQYLNLNFLTQNDTCLIDADLQNDTCFNLILDANSHLWKVVLRCFLARKVTHLLVRVWCC